MKLMRKIKCFVLGLILFGNGSVSVQGMAERTQSESIPLRIVITSSVSDGLLEKEKWFVDKVSEITPELLLDNGNFSRNEDITNADFILRNGFDAVNLGTNEFNRGTEYTYSIKEDLSDIPLLSSSFTDSSGNFVYCPYIYRELPDPVTRIRKVAVFGALDITRINSEGSGFGVLSLEESYYKITEDFKNKGIVPDTVILLYSGNSSSIDQNFLLSHQEITAVITDEETPTSRQEKGSLLMSPGKNMDTYTCIGLLSGNESDGTPSVTVEYKNEEVQDKGELSADLQIDNIENNLIKKEGVYTITKDFTSSITEDSSLPDLFNILQISHYLPYETEGLPVVSQTNLSPYLLTLSAGEYDGESLSSKFSLPYYPVAVKLNGNELKNVMEESFSVYEKSCSKENPRAKSDMRIQETDFYENLFFTVDTEKPEGRRLCNIRLVSKTGEEKELDDDDEVIIVMPEKKAKKISETLNKEIEIIWKSPLPISDLLINYMNSIESKTLSPSVNNNWKLVCSDLEKSLSSRNFPLVNLKEIPNFQDKESPSGKFILDSLREESGTDLCLMEKKMLKNGLKEGEINDADLKDLTFGEYGVVATGMKGEEINRILETEVMSGNIQMSGLNAVFSDKSDESPTIMKVTDSQGIALNPEKTYKVALVTEDKNPDYLTLNEILSESLSKKENVDYKFTPSVEFTSEKTVETSIENTNPTLLAETKKATESHESTDAKNSDKKNSEEPQKTSEEKKLTFSTIPRKNTEEEKKAEKKIYFKDNATGTENNKTQTSKINGVSGKTAGKNLPETGNRKSPLLVISGVLMILSGVIYILIKKRKTQTN